jgi:PAS domain S-box-containing protein
MKDQQYQDKKLRSIYKLAKAAWWEYNVASQLFTYSEEAFELIGRSFHGRQQITMQEFLTYVHPEDVHDLKAFFLTIYNQTITSFEHRIIDTIGDIRYINHQTEVIHNTNGQSVCVMGVMQDITKQKEAVASIVSSEQKYKLLFNQSLIPKLIFDADTLLFVEVNDAAIKQYGYSREEFLTLQILDLRPIEDRPSLLEVIEEYRDQYNAVYTSMHRHMKKSGELFYVQIEAILIKLPTGVHSLVIATDMTEKLQMQQRIISEKVTAQKEIARAIIETQEKERQEIGKELHDNVNQILTTIKLYIENIRDYPEHKTLFIDKSVTLTQKAINELRLLSKQLVTPVINDLNFKAAILEMVDHYRSLKLFRVYYNFDLEEERLNKDLQLTIYRIIQEQMNNIVKHAKASVVNIALTNEDNLKVCITDDGTGFNMESPATGMGINNIRNRAEVYKGHVSLNSSPGKGCSLIVTFPLKPFQ